MLALPAGTYAEGSPEYTAARDGLVAWCATPGRRDRASCAAATSLFDTVSQDTACAGRLELSATTGPGRLVSGSCRPHVVATYSREDDGWYVDDVGVRPAEVRPEEGEDPNRDAREKAMDELRRGAAMKEPSELDPDDGVGAW
ncbi:MAG: hypothetical protein Q8P41_01345 [Pseudomonadota bacterium]|nr:hypothetical protein [Pseudomonadota bacterium]